MPLQIITGRSKSGKSKYIYDRIASLVADGNEVILVVPEQYSHGAERKLLEYTDAIDENKVEVFSFNRLASSTEKKLNCAPVSYIDPICKALIVKSVLKNNDFVFYRNAATQNGMADMISQTIDEFKKYMILPETLISLAEETDDEILAMKLRDLALAYSEYEKIISGEFSSSDDVLSVLAGYLKDTDIYRNKYVFFDEFSTFVPQELNIISALCTSCIQVCISLCYDAGEKNTTLFMPTGDTIEKLKKCTTEKVSILNLDGTHFSSPELAFMEKALYTFPLQTYGQKCENVRVLSSANPGNEVELCADEILRLLRENKYMYKDIGIICSDIEMYERHIERVFERSSIEYFIDNKSDVINHHLIRFILGLIEVYVYDYNYSSVFNYLKAAFVDTDAADIALLEKYIKRTNLKRTSWLNTEKWNSILDANYPEDNSAKEIINKIRNKYIVPLAEMHEKIKGRNTVKNNLTALYELMLELKLPDTIVKYIEYFNNASELRYAKEYEKLWDIVVDSFDKIMTVDANTVVNVTEFYDLLTAAFSQSKIGFIPSAVDRIIVGNTERTRTDNLKVLFVLGVNEGVFPMAPKADGILSDVDKNSMKTLGTEFSTTSSVASFYSQFCAYSAFTMPSEKIYISYSKADNDFKGMHKSYIIDKIVTMFGIKEISEPSIWEYHKISDRNSAKEQLADVVASSENIEPDVLWKSVYRYFENEGEFNRKLREFALSDNIASNLSDKNLKALISVLSYTSVSKIERYMTCKYAYFIDYILKLDQIKEERVDALDIGNITHHVLEILSKEFGYSRQSYIDMEENIVLERIEELIKEELVSFTDKTDEMSKRDIYTITRLKNLIYLSFMAVRNQFVNSSFEPLGYEIEFKDGTELGAIQIETPEGQTINLTGKIDRADIYTCDDVTYVRVIDYKTGYKEFKLDDVLYGLSVQLVVYLNKLVSSREDYTYGGALYFPVTRNVSKEGSRLDDIDIEKNRENDFKLKGIAPFDDRVLSGYDEKFASSLKHGASKNKRISIQGFEIMDMYLKKKLGEICGEILNGNIEIAPSKKGEHIPCEYCNYNSICRFDPENPDNNYSCYSSKNVYEDIIKEMEEAISVDQKPTDGD